MLRRRARQLQRPTAPAPSLALDVAPWKLPLHLGKYRISCSPAGTRGVGAGIHYNPECAVAPEPSLHLLARGRARQLTSLKAHTWHFSANFLIARLTVSPTVDVE